VQQAEYNEGKRDRPPDLSARQQILSAIKSNASDYPTLPELVERLQDQGIEVRVNLAQPGISFQREGISFQGNSLGRGYSFNGLRKQFQIDYQSDRDDEALIKLMEKSITSSGFEAVMNITEDIEEESNLEERQGHDNSEWTTIQQIIEPYQFSHALIHQLYQEEILRIDRKKRLTFSQRSLNGEAGEPLTLNHDGSFEPKTDSSQDKSFWISHGDRYERAIISNDPLEVIIINSIDQAHPQRQNTIYIAAQTIEQLNELNLEDLEQVYISSSCCAEIKDYVTRLNLETQEINP